MVYFVQMEEDGPIWIGTSLFPPEYLHAFRVGYRPELKVYGSFPGDSHTVRQIASELYTYRLEGDWFKGQDVVVACLERYWHIESYEPVDGICYPILWRDTADGTIFRQENGYLIKTRYIDAVPMLQDAQEDATH